MWKTLSEWLFGFFNMSRELEDHRETLRRLEERTRNLEEALKLLAQEQRHARELESAEREKLLLRLQNEVVRLKALPPPRGRKKR
jgi:archaellum component FlaC